MHVLISRFHSLKPKCKPNPNPIHSTVVSSLVISLCHLLVNNNNNNNNNNKLCCPYPKLETSSIINVHQNYLKPKARFPANSFIFRTWALTSNLSNCHDVTLIDQSGSLRTPLGELGAPDTFCYTSIGVSKPTSYSSTAATLIPDSLKCHASRSVKSYLILTLTLI